MILPLRGVLIDHVLLAFAIHALDLEWVVTPSVEGLIIIYGVEAYNHGTQLH